MNLNRLLLEGWSANPWVLGGCSVFTLLFARAFGTRARWRWLIAALAVVVLALLSPLAALADGVLFSAHMTQHILLLLIAPGLLLLALPRTFTLRVAHPLARRLPLLGWAAGIGAMWLWHAPALCNAAAVSGPVRALQTLSLLALGTLFWWPILAPAERDRLLPGHGVAYLFTACLGCSALGMILTLTPVEICSVYQAPLAASQPWADFRGLFSAQHDRQIGGLLMWIPMCSVYVAAIMLELSRWHGAPAAAEELSS